MVETRTRLHELLDEYLEARGEENEMKAWRTVTNVDIEVESLLARKRRLPRELDPLLRNEK